MDDAGRRKRDPTGARTGLRILREAFAIMRREWKRLLPVVVVILALNFILTIAMVTLARPVANLDAMSPFYEIEENSTAPDRGGAAKEEEPSPLWKLHLTGELFADLSTVMAMFFLSCRIQGAELHNRRFWRGCQSLALAIIVWEVVSFFVLTTLQANGLEDLFRKFDAIFGCGYLLTAVVVSQGELHGLRAIEEAWELVSLKLKEVSVIGVMVLLMRAALDLVYQISTAALSRYSRRYHAKQEVAPPAIREDTTAEMVRFSLGAAILHAILQLFVCSAILVLYMESIQSNTQGILRNTAVGCGISENQEFEIKKIKKLRRLFLMHAASEDTIQVFAQELLKHCDRALDQGCKVSGNQEFEIKKIKKLTRLFSMHAASDDTRQVFAQELLKHCDRALTE